MSTIGLKCKAFWPKGLTNYSHLSRACVPLVVGSRAPRLSTFPLFLCRSTLGVWPCLLQWSNCTHMIFSSSCGQLVQNHALLQLQSFHERLLSFEQSLINMFLYVHRLQSWQQGAWFITQFWRLRLRHSAHSGNPQVRQLWRSSDEGKVINGSNGMPPAMWDEHKHPRPQSNIKASP